MQVSDNSKSLEEKVAETKENHVDSAGNIIFVGFLNTLVLSNVKYSRFEDFFYIKMQKEQKFCVYLRPLKRNLKPRRTDQHL